jgi:hypothetical protein
MGDIKATFDSSRFHGHVTKTITMQTNSPEQPQVLFQLQGNVKELLSVSTTRIAFDLGSVDQVGSTQVTISNQSEQKIVLRDATSTTPQLSGTLDRLELPPGEKAILSVRGTLGAEKERLNGYLIVSTDFKPMPQIRILVSGRLVK